MLGFNEGVVALNLPIGPLKTPFGLELVPRCCLSCVTKTVLIAC